MLMNSLSPGTTECSAGHLETYFCLTLETAQFSQDLYLLVAFTIRTSAIAMSSSSLDTPDAHDTH